MGRQLGNCMEHGMREWGPPLPYRRRTYNHSSMTSPYIRAHHRCTRCCTVRGSVTPGKQTITSPLVSSVCLPRNSGGTTQTTRGIPQLCSVFPVRSPRFRRKGRRASCHGKDLLPRLMIYFSEVRAIPQHGGRTPPFLTSRVRESPSTTHSRQTGAQR